MHVELASLDSICKEVDHGAVAWLHLSVRLSLLMPWGHVVLLAGGESGDA